MFIYAPFIRLEDENINKLVRLGLTAGSTFLAAAAGSLIALSLPLSLGIAAATAVCATAALVHETAYTVISQIAMNIIRELPDQYIATFFSTPATMILGFSASIAVAAAIGVSLELAAVIASVGILASCFFEMTTLLLVGMGCYLLYELVH